ncbi:MAG: hypothetical protein ACPGWR_04020 [Ardenticatenaceae bacterium]
MSRAWLRLRQSIPLTILILVALLQGILHLFLLPPWQHYDEPTHFEYAWLIANRGRLPEMGDGDHTMRREVAATMVERNFYWNLTPPDLLTDEREISLGFTELGHPPLYYVLVSLPLRLTRHLNMTTQLYVARCVSIVLFLLIVLVAIGLIRDLTSPGHILRWLIPLTVALLPPFASHMSAVNNDVGAVLMLSLFLWGTIRLIRKGLSLPRLLWVTSTALLALFTKNTASVAVLMLPVGLAIALWVHKKWPWRWFCLGVVAIGAVALVATVDVGDAAYWYRDLFHAPQPYPTRLTLAPDAHAVTLEVTHADVNRRLLNPLLPQDVKRIKESMVTVGGWLSADKEGQVLSPGFLRSEQGTTNFIAVGEPIHVSTTPTFFAHSYWIPEKTAVVYYAFWAKSLEPREEPLQLYLNGAFLIPGEWSEQLASSVNTYPFLPDVVQENNLVRNPSGEQSWLHLRLWVNRALERYARRSPTYLFHAMQDVPKNGPFLLGVIAPWLLNDFFSAFAWGHVRLEGAFWFKLLVVLLALTAVGCLKWLIQSRFARNAFLWPALFSLALVASVVLLNALLWPLPFRSAKVQFPSSRYLYVAIIPIALFLAGGWWALWPQAYRRQGTLLWIAFLVLLNMISIMTIYSFYQSLPVG